MDRRQFLARTALGSAGVVGAGGLGLLAPEAVAGGPEDVAAGELDPYFAEGKVLSINGSSLVIASSELLIRRIQVTAGTTFWKLRETTFDDVRVDDRLYASGVPADDGVFVAERVWVNIVNLHVEIHDVGRGRIDVAHAHGRLRGRIVPETAVVYDFEPPSRDLSRLRPGQHVQLIGAWHPDTDEVDVATIYA
jgi:hypothetical protein